MGNPEPLRWPWSQFLPIVISAMNLLVPKLSIQCPHLESTMHFRSLSFSSCCFWVLFCHLMELSKSPMGTPSCTCQASLIPPFPTIFPYWESIDISQRILREMEAQGRKVYEVVDIDPPSIKASNNHRAWEPWEEKESILTIGSLCQVGGMDMKDLEEALRRVWPP